jgi:hypothetical protein
VETTSVRCCACNDRRCADTTSPSTRRWSSARIAITSSPDAAIALAPAPKANPLITERRLAATVCGTGSLPSMRLRKLAGATWRKLAGDMAPPNSWNSR